MGQNRRHCHASMNPLTTIGRIVTKISTLNTLASGFRRSAGPPISHAKALKKGLYRFEIVGGDHVSGRTAPQAPTTTQAPVTSFPSGAETRLALLELLIGSGESALASRYLITIRVRSLWPLVRR